MRGWVFLLFGVAFGFVLSRAGASDYDVVQGMFRFETFQLYGVIGTAVAVTAPGLWWLKRRGRSVFGGPIRLSSRPPHAGNVVGGLLFGAGWAVTGMCPGPIFVALGEGKLYALGALAGALTGAALFGLVRPRLATWLRLPSGGGTPAAPSAPESAIAR